MNDMEKRLVAALRSGEYRQIKNCLHTSEGFCCLGVACDISNLSSWTKFESADIVLCYDDNDAVLPESVMKMLNWWSSVGTLNFVDRNGNSLSLSDLNDFGFSFSKIADIIEAGLVKHEQ